MHSARKLPGKFSLEACQVDERKVSLDPLAAALLKRPELFDNYVLVSPSLWWDDGSLATAAEERLRGRPGSDERIFIAMARDDDMMQDAVDRLRSALEANAGPRLRWRYELFPEETHRTILHRAAYRGFEWLGSED